MAGEAAIAAGLYWVATGKLPVDEIKGEAKQGEPKAKAQEELKKGSKR